MLDTENILKIDNLKTGIGVWRKKPRWDQDFHNALYKKLYQYKVNGLDYEWWDRIVDHFSAWKAIRPYSKDQIRQRGRKYLNGLQMEFTEIKKKYGNTEPDLENSKWGTLSNLFEISAEIKETMPFSPVFASKLCHFIFPSAFLVVDREVVNISGSYYRHWDNCQTQWINCTAREELNEVLRRVIPGEVYEHYPWSTKIVELCIIGGKENKAEH